MTGSHISKRVRGVGWVERVGEEHGVIDLAAQIDVEPAKHVQSELQIVTGLGDGSIFKKSFQLEA